MADARDVLDRIRQELADVDEEIRRHPYPDLFAAGRAPLDALIPFVATQHHIARSDHRSFAGMVERFGERPEAWAFFASLFQGEAAAIEGLARLADRLGLELEVLGAYEVEPDAFAYAAYLAWCARFASAAEIAAALLLNFDAWGENCRRLRDALRAHYELSPEDTAFLDAFADLPPFDETALPIVQDGLDRGVPERKIRRAARLFQGYERMFWDAMARLAAGAETDRER